ncbi:hypothetical protein [Flavobacterium pectinovorum]|uniref:Uncharacterized protein n=1 Tax=Flavobacterium pectinovorum TaxID=29533 RepID=A0A502E8B8_9FLAO|nr:hypothetical protein [Flavobacterium pectinovorum]TPG33945.1 hypothetical protein EAH81_23650 [Flavobacterium pectinovorum]
MPIPEVLNAEKFESHKELIRILYLVDGDFKNMCDDYSMSRFCIEKYKEKVAQDVGVKKEYENLFDELEKEILIYIKKNC